MSKTKTNSGAPPTDGSSHHAPDALVTALKNLSPREQDVTTLMWLFTCDLLESLDRNTLAEFTSSWLSHLNARPAERGALRDDLRASLVLSPGRAFRHSSTARNIRAKQHLDNRILHLLDTCRGNQQAFDSMVIKRAPWQWAGTNLLAVVAELDAAVSATEAGDSPGAIEHIEAAKTSIFEDARPVRVSVAAQILGLSRRTVDGWAEAGLLTLVESPGTTVKMVDPRGLYEVKVLVDDLRAAGKKRGLAEAVWQRLQDQRVLEDLRLQESLEQVRRGEGVSLEDYLAQSSDDEESGDDDR
ncbi:hypothetical protein [Kitasatospora sp. NPDC056800]|uniref:hypothetical protein n=1 Tax=Kitasatospora sp. NPDC056800 TaxID=3345948 RepID=UPI00369855FE